jgi:5'-methylthioinosine phosphorylase
MRSRPGTWSAMETEPLALIAGSGFAKLDLTVVARSPTKTPFGDPSSPVLTVALGARRIACIVRHGEHHPLAPHEINYRANLWALQQRGVRQCVGINTVGAIARGFAPGDLAVPDQLIDYTHGRIASYSGGGRVVHVDFAEPFEPLLRGRLATAVAECGFGTRAGTYGVTQGPRLETAAEIDRLERDGCAMVGMTAMPEACLARELGIDYAICAFAVNYAAGRSPDGSPAAAQIERCLDEGLRRVATVLTRLAASGLGSGTV